MKQSFLATKGSTIYTISAFQYLFLSQPYCSDKTNVQKLDSMSEKLAPIPFLILKFCGLWRPLSWSSWRKLIYNLYTVLILVTLVTIALFVLIAVCNMSFDHENFAENVFLMFALINAIFKATNVLISRRYFIEMLNLARDDRWQKHRSPEENEIHSRYGKTIRKISIYFTTAVFVSILMRVLAPVLDFSGEVKLPVNAFCPCNISYPSCYWSLYWHQAIGTGVATLTHAAKDCLISALLLQTCAQLEVLKHRLLSIPESSEIVKMRKESLHQLDSHEQKLIAECIRDHESIFKFAKVLNNSLNVMLFGQIAVTIPNLCLSIYLLSNQNIASMEFVMTMQFFSAVVIELFFFCWYGNEVTLNSLDVENAICEMDWTTLSIDSRKDLLIMMVRASKPILFRVGPIMNMNIDSFLSIMKTSYSAFSVLQSAG